MSDEREAEAPAAPAATATAQGTGAPAPGQPRGRLPLTGSTIIQAVTEGHSVVITILAVFVALVIGAVLIVASDPVVLRAWDSFGYAPGAAFSATWNSVCRGLLGAVRGLDLQPGDDRGGLPRRLDRGDLLPAVAHRVRGDPAHPHRPVGGGGVPGRHVQHRRGGPVDRRRARRDLARLRGKPADRAARGGLHHRRLRRRCGDRLDRGRDQGADRRARGHPHDHDELRHVQPAGLRADQPQADAGTGPDQRGRAEHRGQRDAAACRRAATAGRCRVPGRAGRGGRDCLAALAQHAGL